jgi:hypothetical protein
MHSWLEGPEGALYQVLWPGFRLPPFAADDVIRQARRFQTGGK